MRAFNRLATRAAWLFGLLLTVATSQAQQLHAIVAGDLSPAAQWGTLEPNLTLDMASVFGVLHENIPEDRLNYQSFPMEEDSDSDPAKVLEVVDALRPTPDDTVLFYYTGHGIIDESGQHCLALAQGLLPRNRLLEHLRRRPSRLVILITDCCNSRADGKLVFAPAPSYASPNRVSPLFQTLLFTSQGVVDINGASPGEGAFFLRQDTGNFSLPGSIFTKELTDWLTENQRTARSWNDLVREVGIRVHASFQENYPKGTQVAKGAPVQTQQNVHAIAYPNKPEKSGPRTGMVVRDFEGAGALIASVAPDSPASHVYDLRNKEFVTLHAGQSIIAIQGKPISRAQQLDAAIREAPQIVRIGVRDSNSGDHEYLMRMQY